MLKLRSTGRGRFFSPARGLLETAQQLAYAFSWPARLMDHIPAFTRAQLLQHHFRWRAPGGARPPLRVGFVSDLHIGPTTPPALLDHAFDQLAAAAPDLLVLGGDYVSYEVRPRDVDRLRALVTRVPAATKVAVLGNHDLWTRHELIERGLADAGAQLLLNRSLRLPPPHDDVVLVGLDDAWTGDVDADTAFADTSGALVLVVSHAPEAVPFAAGRGARLMMCGHTHGGQVATPWGPLVVWGPLGRRWPCGLYDVDGMSLFVSRGLGCSDIPLRAWAPPDVALFTIT